MNKVVINDCFGGFGLSKKAMLRLFELGYKDSYYNENNLGGDTFFPDIQRHDPRLIKVVEELGSESYGSSASLSIIEIKGNIYRITEYDGAESIETPDALDWITI